MDLLGQITEPAWRPTPLAALALGETPSDLHFVRDHFPVPKLDPRAWTLELAGANGRLTLGSMLVRGVAWGVWITAAIGMACGAGLALLALAVTAAYFVVAFLFPPVVAKLPRSRYLPFGVRVVYADGRGILREVLQEATRLGYSIASVETHQLEHEIRGVAAVAVTLEVRGQPNHEPLTASLSDHPGVLEVTATDLVRATE